MFASKDEGIASWFQFLNIFWIFPIAFGPLDVSITFGGKDAPKGAITIKQTNMITL